MRASCAWCQLSSQLGTFVAMLGILRSLCLEPLRAVCKTDAAAIAGEVARARGAQCIGTFTCAQCNSGSWLRNRIKALYI